MKPEFLALLRCPYCRGSFAFREIPRAEFLAEESGVLRCACSAFPVIDGIPVLQKAAVGIFENTTGTAQSEGTSIAELVRLLESGRSLEALERCLAPPAQPLPDRLKRLLPWRVANGEFLRNRVRRKESRRLRTEILAKRNRISVREILDFYFHPGSALGPAMGHYFALRFCQPRHLAALSLLAALPPDSKPVLDIACGLGHLEHYLTHRTGPIHAVGTDMNFFHVWIARHWFAPSADYVCANAGDGLPFADGCFSASLCSDAYHYIPNRAGLLREIERCAPGRPVFLTRVGNRDVMPNEGAERSLRDYLKECGGGSGEGADLSGGSGSREGAVPGRGSHEGAAKGERAVSVFSETDLLQAYLQGRNPLDRLAGNPEGLEELREAKWLSFAWNLGPALRARPREKSEPPHAVGRIGVNPIYRASRRTATATLMRFDFPLPWYAYENHAMLSYHPRTAELPTTAREGLQAWRDDAGLAKLVESYVLIGMPERFGPG